MKTGQNIAGLLATATQPPQIPQIAKKQTGTVVLLAFLLVVSFVGCVGVASAQTPPDSVTAVVTSLGIQVTFVACQVSTDSNCVYPFSVYRTPPGSLWGYSQLGNNGFSYQGIFNDQKSLTKGQAYTYKVCSGPSAKSDGSNCKTSNSVFLPRPPPPPPPKPTVKLTSTSPLMPSGDAMLNWTSTNATSLDLEPGVGGVSVPAGSKDVNPAQTTTYTITATGAGGTATANFVICGPLLPPQNLSVLAYDDINLKWANPVQPSCQQAPADIWLYRKSPPANWEFIGKLSATGGVLPTHYDDQGIFGASPHSPYQYLLCEGGSDGSNVNCALSIVAFRWGADPVLTATRVNANAVQLRLALDEADDISSIAITRQGSDDPCRQGQKLGNGLQGCPTVGPNGTSVAQTVAVYNWTAANPGFQNPPGLQNSKSAPYVITLPNDTSVKSNVEYYYQAQVGWAMGNVSGPSQISGTATAPSFYGTFAAAQNTSALKAAKLSSGAPPPPSQSGASLMTNPMSRATATAPTAQANAAPPSRSVTAARAMLVPMTTPTSQMLQAANPMISSVGAPASASLAPSPTAAKPAIASTNTRMTVPTFRAISNIKQAQALPNAANLNAAIKQVQQRPHDAQALYALGKAYCASSFKNAGVSDMYMALMLAEQAHNTSLVSQIKASLAGEGVSTERLDQSSK